MVSSGDSCDHLLNLNTFEGSEFSRHCANQTSLMFHNVHFSCFISFNLCNLRSFSCFCVSRCSAPPAHLSWLIFVLSRSRLVGSWDSQQSCKLSCGLLVNNYEYERESCHHLWRAVSAPDTLRYPFREPFLLVY
jgi:hypothetical protein